MEIDKNILSDDQCNEFRRLPYSFNDMIRTTFKAGQDSILQQLHNRFELWQLDYSGVNENQQVKDQGILICIKTEHKGFFSPLLEKYPSRQDLAIKTRINI